MRKALLLSFLLCSLAGSSSGGMVETVRFVKHAGGAVTVLLLPLFVVRNTIEVGEVKVEALEIVLRIDAEGKVTSSDGAPLVDDAAILKFLMKEKAKIDMRAFETAVRLQVSKEASFASVQRVLKVIDRLTLTDVRFSPIQPAAVDPVARIEPKVLMPSVLEHLAEPEIQPMLIAIDAKGLISINRGPAREEMDRDPADHKLPRLSQRVEMFAAACQAAATEPRIELQVDEEAKHQRLVDVLDALNRAEVEKVEFTGLEDEE